MMDLVARCLEYPETDTPAVARRAAREARTPGRDASQEALALALLSLASWLETSRPGEAEERYSGLFDLSPVCTLNLGYHLFGESYERGALLAGLSSELLKAGVDPGAEIPDHLSVLLRLLGRLAPDDARILLEDALLPGLAHVLTKLQSSTDPWSDLCRALAPVLARQVDAPKEAVAHA